MGALAETGNGTERLRERETARGIVLPPPASTAMMMTGITTTVTSGSFTMGVSTVVSVVVSAAGKRKSDTEIDGTETRRRANTSPPSAGNMMARRGRVIVDTNTRRANATKRRRRKGWGMGRSQRARTSNHVAPPNNTAYIATSHYLPLPHPTINGCAV